MLVFYMLLKEIHYYDSMSGYGDRYINYGLRWLADEIMDKKGIAIDINDWTQFQQEDYVPQQHNGYDCGVYTCALGYLISANKRLPDPKKNNEATFTKDQVQNMRLRIKESFMRGGITP